MEIERIDLSLIAMRKAALVVSRSKNAGWRLHLIIAGFNRAALLVAFPRHGHSAENEW